MDHYAGRLLADRYRLPRLPSEEFEFAESRAFDTASGQEVLVRQVPLPEVLDAEVLDADGRGPGGPGARDRDRATRTPDDPVVRRALEAAMAAARLPDHPRLDQVFDVFVQGGGLWIVSELVSGRPLAALLAERRLGPFRAAEVAADLLAALRIVHAHGWTHRNVTARTVLILDDGRALLTGLVAGAAEEVLCGYDPLPPPAGVPDTFAAAPRTLPAPRDAAPGTDGPRAVEGPRAAAQPPPATPHPAAPHPAAPRPDAPHPDDVRPVEPPAEALDRWERSGGATGPWAPESWEPYEEAPERAPGRPDPWADETAALPPVPEGWERRAPERSPGRPDPWADETTALPPVPEGWERETGRTGPGPVAGHDWHGTPEAPSPREDRQGGGGRGESAARIRPHGETTASYERWARPAADETGHGGDPLPATWDFENGTGPEGRTGPGAPSARPPAAGGGSAADRAARSGAIAAYRAGTQAAAARRQGEPPSADRPAGRPPQPARSGWESPAQHHQHPQDQQHHRQPEQPRPPRREHEPQERQERREARPPADPALLPAQRSATAPGGRYRGPEGALAAERARQARIMTVGAVTERWAPEQAGPVHDHWQLAPPVGPPADFWALGALLFRAVQGYPPYPEDSAAELVEAVCGEQPAFAEDCGALRPIVESLLRQDPTERPSAEELRGWLRSLLRSAPEPEVGRRTVTAPPALEPGRPADPRRLPIVRRRGELVGPRRRPRQRKPRAPGSSPRRLGKLLLVLVLLGLAGGIAYVLAFMSDTGTRDDPSAGGGGTAQEQPPAEEEPSPDPTGDGGDGGADTPSSEPTEDATRPSPAEGDQEPAPPPEGYTAQQDAAGFSLTVPDGWQRREDGGGRIVYADGALEIVVVPGRDGAADSGVDPMAYQLTRQPELGAYRAYQFGEESSLIQTRVGNVEMAEGVFRWREDEDLVAYNRVMLVDDAYHVVLVRGPAAEEERLAEVYGVTAASYRAGE
ncbi:serine/threonine protein kinase [Streptomyces sp. NPDC049881]|uniref:serine/threonine protein kinase n=1 Tax=Streptomyces sp. NPDC049881 TaxID=3155778 RepID=UPI0034128225